MAQNPGDRDTVLFSTGFDADGTFQAVTIPSTEQCRNISINCFVDATTDYSDDIPSANFRITANSDGTYATWCQSFEVRLNRSGGQVLCYVKATAGYKFVVTGTY